MKIKLKTDENHALERYPPEMIESSMKYIHEHPVRAGIVGKREDYMFSSVRNYPGLEALIAMDYW